MSVRNCQLGSVSIAEPMPTKPPPAWKYVLEGGFAERRSRPTVAARVEEDDRAVAGEAGWSELCGDLGGIAVRG